MFYVAPCAERIVIAAPVMMPGVTDARLKQRRFGHKHGFTGDSPTAAAQAVPLSLGQQALRSLRRSRGQGLTNTHFPHRLFEVMRKRFMFVICAI